MATQELPDTASLTSTPARSERLRSRIGWALTALPCALVLAAGLRKVVGPLPEPMIVGMRHLGVEPAFARTVGIIEIVVVVLCLVPRTTFIGAILFAGWAGGAMMTHLRVGEPAYFQALLAIVVWIGLGLRRPAEISALLGIRRAA
jgi:hypothetical protein